jgi:hypothetical protein
VSTDYEVPPVNICEIWHVDCQEPLQGRFSENLKETGCEGGECELDPVVSGWVPMTGCLNTVMNLRVQTPQSYLVFDDQIIRPFFLEKPFISCVCYRPRTVCHRRRPSPHINSG